MPALILPADFIRLEIALMPGEKRAFMRYLAYLIAAAKLPTTSKGQFSEQYTEQSVTWIEQFIEDAVYFYNKRHKDDRTMAAEVLDTLRSWWLSDIEQYKREAAQNSDIPA